MIKIATVKDNVVTGIYFYADMKEAKKFEKMGAFPDSDGFVIATEEADVGDTYDAETGGFSKPAATVDLTALKSAKKSELDAAFQSVIDAGVDVETSLGVKHFSLTPEAQDDLKTYRGEITAAQAGQPSMVDLNQGVWYHADGEPHRFWSVEDFFKILQTAFPFISAQKTYRDMLKARVDGLGDAGAVNAVRYGMEMPG